MAQDPKRPFARRLLGWLARCLFALGLFLGILAWMPERTLNPLLRWAAPKVAQRFGWELSIDRWSGSPFSTWSLGGVELRAKKGPGPFSIERLGEVQINLQGPLGKWPGLHNLGRVWARDGELRLRIRAGNSDAPTAASEPFDPRTLPDLDLDRIGLEIDLGSGGMVEVHDLRAGLRAGMNATSTAKLRLDGVLWTLPNEPPEALRIEAQLELGDRRLELLQGVVIQPKRGRLALQGHLAWPAQQPLASAFSANLQNGRFRECSGIEATLDGVWRSGRLAVQTLDLTANGGVTLHGSDIEFDPFASDRLQALSGSVVAGADDLGTTLAQLLGQPRWPLRKTRIEGRFEGQKASLRQASLAIELPSWPTPLEVRAVGSMDFSADTWPVDVHGNVFTQAGERSLPQAGKVSWEAMSADFVMAGPWLHPDGTVDLAAARWLCEPAGQPPYRIEGLGKVRSEAGVLSAEDLRFALHEATQPVGSLGIEGTLGTVERWVNNYRKSDFDLVCDLSLLRLAILADWTGAIRRIDGNAQGKLAWKGNLASATWNGQLEVVAPNLRLSAGESWTNVHASCTFPGTPVATLAASATYGGAPVELAGTMEWKAAQLAWDLQLAAEGIPLVRTPEARIRANLDVSLKGSPTAAQVRGDVVLAYGRLEHDFDLSGKLFALLEGREERKAGEQAPWVLEWPMPPGWDIDVNLRTDQPIAVISDLAKSELAVQGRLVGGSGRLYPEGNVSIGSGQVSLPGSTLKWQQGLVLLPKGGGDPTIEASGTTRLAGHDLTVRIHGALAAPVLEITSVPKRPRYDLLVLLMTGELPGDGDLSRATQSLSVYLAKDLLRRWLGSNNAEDSDGLLQRLEITAGREVSESGLGTLEAMFRLRGALDGRGRALWITAERDRYEDVNFGLRFVLRPR